MMKKDAGTGAQKDIWERTGWLWTAVFHLNLVVVIVLGLTSSDNAGYEGRILALGIGLAVWQLSLIHISEPTRPY